MFRILTEPINEKSLIAGEALTHGDPVYEGTDGKAWKSSTAANDVKTVWIALKNPELSIESYQMNETINSGMPARVANGFQFMTDFTKCKSTDNFTTASRGDFLGIKSGKIALYAAATASTTDYFRFESFTGDTSSGILVGSMKVMI